MRRGTILVLLALILAFAYFGWAAFGVLALTFLLFLVLAVAAVAIGLWVIKRRMRRALEELGRTLEARVRGAEGAWTRRDDAIDVEPVDPAARKPRDGADDPDELAADEEDDGEGARAAPPGPTGRQRDGRP